MGEYEGASRVREAVVIAMYPDVCLKSGKRVPYDIYAKASDDVKASPNTRYKSEHTLRESSRLSKCYEDGAADAGVNSGCVEGYCRPVEGLSETVHVNRERAVREDTVFEMNTNGPEGRANTKGKLVYIGPLPSSLIQRGPILMTPEAQKEFERRRLETKKKLEENFDKPGFYDQVADFDPDNADLWHEMSDIQKRFADAENFYSNPETAVYSASMRETLHGSLIDLFDNSDALSVVTSQGSTGLYDWFIKLHGTAFSANGAWNLDFLPQGVEVLQHTSPKMIGQANKLAQGMQEHDPFAAHAAEQVRAMRAKKGLQVTRRPGEKPRPPAIVIRPVGAPEPPVGPLGWDPPPE